MRAIAILSMLVVSFGAKHRSASPANERLQIMPRVSAGVLEKSYAGCLQQ